RVARVKVQALDLPHVPAVPDDGRIEIGVDRLTRDADVHAGELAALVDAGGEFALGDRPEVVVLHVLFAAPDQLHRDTGKLLGDGDGLARVVLRAAAPPEAAAEVELVDLGVLDRHAGLLARGRQRGLGVLGGRPDLDAIRR